MREVLTELGADSDRIVNEEVIENEPFRLSAGS